MLKKIVALFAFVAVATSADVINKDFTVSGETDGFQGFASGVVSNVANTQRGSGVERDAFIGCNIDSTFEDGTIANCAAKLTTGEDVFCFTDRPDQITAVASITDSSFVSFEFFGPICTRVFVENGSQYGAKARAFY